MAPAAWVVAWVAALAVLLLERSGQLDLMAWGVDCAPRTALCSLPWLVLAGLPRLGTRGFDARAWGAGCMVCLPVLVLAVALDLEAGVAWPRALQTLLPAWSLVGLSALAADVARARTLARHVHAVCWTLVCVLLPMLVESLQWGPRVAGRVPGWIETLARTSPLDWAWASVQGAPAPWPALSATLGLLVLCGGLARESRS